MKVTQALKIFGSRARIAEVLKISEQAVHQWPEKVPELRAYQLKAYLEGGGSARKSTKKKRPRRATTR